MPKLKTVKGVKERFHVTGRGKFIARRAGKRHLLTHKRSKAKRNMRKARPLADVDTTSLKALLPYRRK